LKPSAYQAFNECRVFVGSVLPDELADVNYAEFAARQPVVEILRARGLMEYFGISF
jgi:hypothetical protein